MVVNTGFWYYFCQLLGSWKFSFRGLSWIAAMLAIVFLNFFIYLKSRVTWFRWGIRSSIYLFTSPVVTVARAESFWVCRIATGS